VLHLMRAGGWFMAPLVACSILALAIVLERFWALRRRAVMPPNLTTQVWRWYEAGQLTQERIQWLREGSPLGRILAAGLVNRSHSRDVMKEAIMEAGRQAIADLEHYLNTLGTIASVSPLLGLLGTVSGMIQAFATLGGPGTGNPVLLAGGISEALITTAAGLVVAIPSVIFHRYFNGQVDRFAIDMEEQALKMVEIILGEREKDTL
jgi:biopolymer transport protein ExbB